jgi:Spy/CpxP family protein refolding chaperone
MQPSKLPAPLNFQLLTDGAAAVNSRRIRMKNKIIVVLVMASAWVLAVPAAHAQAASKDSPTVTDQDIQLLRQDLRSNKKQLVAANLTLTDTEATKFWPVYDQYTAEMTRIGDQKYALIKEYAQSFGSLTDAQALSLVNRSLALDEAIAQLRIKYVPIVNRVLPGTKAASFFQIDRRLSGLIDLQLASQIPLVQEQH